MSVFGIPAEDLESGTVVYIDPETGRITRYMRKFDSGATRDSDENKIDYHGFLSHEVLQKYGAYMLRHQKQADGKMRASDNWKKGIPRDAYIKSMYRHFMEVVDLYAEVQPDSGLLTRDLRADYDKDMDEALYALLFNVMGFAYERTQGR
jgi:hypothetical protein